MLYARTVSRGKHATGLMLDADKPPPTFLCMLDKISSVEIWFQILIPPADLTFSVKFGKG